LVEGVQRETRKLITGMENLH